jgi:hypothetical protein
MKRIIQILLFIVVVMLFYMCIKSIRQGMISESVEEMSVFEHFENENSNY